MCDVSRLSGFGGPLVAPHLPAAVTFAGVRFAAGTNACSLSFRAASRMYMDGTPIKTLGHGRLSLPLTLPVLPALLSWASVSSRAQSCFALKAPTWSKKLAANCFKLTAAHWSSCNLHVFSSHRPMLLSRKGQGARLHSQQASSCAIRGLSHKDVH